MRGPVIRQLILKDWRLHRTPILLTTAGGFIAMAVFERGGETPMVIGSVWFFIALIIIGSMLPISAIVNERKKQNLAFVMSLPITCVQYTAAKLISTVVVFLVPWLTMAAAAVLLVETRGVVPRGTIPLLLILLMLPFVGFTLIAGTALIGESEGWGIAANVLCNSSYGLAWYFLTRIPTLMADAKSSQPIWSPVALSIFGGELAFIPLALGITFFVQSRKRDFI